MVTETVNRVKQNIDMRIVVSSIAASVIVGGVAYLAVKSGMKPLVKAGKLVKEVAK